MSRTVYFIEHAWKKRGSTWELSEVIVDEHPVMWLHNMREEYSDTNWQILFWREIPYSLKQLEELNLEV